MQHLKYIYKEFIAKSLYIKMLCFCVQRKPDITIFKMAAHSTCVIKKSGEEEFEILEQLGEGTYGEVVMALDRAIGK